MKGCGCINFIDDIISIIKNDNRHSVRISIEPVWLMIYLMDDPEDDYEEKFVIPIRYDVLTKSVCIPDIDYKELMQDNDGGIDLEEINLIQVLMQYIEKHKETIDQYCSNLSVTRNKSQDSMISYTS